MSIKPFEHFDVIVNAPFGAMGGRLSNDQKALLELVYLPDKHSEFYAPIRLAKTIFEQITAYLKTPNFSFDLPTVYQGSVFQNKVWQEISTIPVGSTLNYKSVGKLIGCGSPRAVGGACGANPYPLIVPCHRVVAASGIGGFAKNDDGFYIQVKHWLLAHEGVHY